MISFRLLGSALMASLLLAPVARAQPPEAQAPKPAPVQPVQPMPPGARPSTTTLMVEITVSRYKADKRLSSVPFVMTVVPEAGRSTLRVGGQVPVPTTTFTPAKEGAAPSNPLISYTYRDIGTNIDVQAGAIGEGRYRLAITVEESSLYPAEAAKAGGSTAGAPAFRSFRTNNFVTLKDGQTMEFTAATDRIDGEVVRIGVKLTVLN